MRQRNPARPERAELRQNLPSVISNRVITILFTLSCIIIIISKLHSHRKGGKLDKLSVFAQLTKGRECEKSITTRCLRQSVQRQVRRGAMHLYDAARRGLTDFFTNSILTPVGVQSGARSRCVRRFIIGRRKSVQRYGLFSKMNTTTRAENRAGDSHDTHFTPVKQGRSVSCRGYNIRREDFAGGGESGERFCISPLKTRWRQTPEKRKTPNYLGFSGVRITR